MVGTLSLLVRSFVHYPRNVVVALSLVGFAVTAVAYLSPIGDHCWPYSLEPLAV